MGGLGVGGAGAALAFQSILADTHATAAVAMFLAILVGDLGLLALVVAAMTVPGWKVSGVWHLIGPAFAIFAVGDSIYLVKVAAGTYAAGGIGDITWPTAVLLVGLAAWRGDAHRRVVSVCDSYDAMVTKRAYRDARDSSWAIAELRRCSGTQFDPARPHKSAVDNRYSVKLPTKPQVLRRLGVAGFAASPSRG